MYASSGCIVIIWIVIPLPGDIDQSIHWNTFLYKAQS